MFKVQSSKLIEIEHLSAGYDGKQVLHDINLTVYQDDYLGIIGPNGGGKTTLMRLILGLMKPTEGTIRYFRKVKDENGKTVLDENGFSVPGASVMVVGTTDGTVTDMDGVYSLSLSRKKAVLCVATCAARSASAIAHGATPLASSRSRSYQWRAL